MRSRVMRRMLPLGLLALVAGLSAMRASASAFPEPEVSFRAERLDAQQGRAPRTWRFPRERLTREEALLSQEAAVVARGAWESALWAFPRGTNPAQAFEDLRSQWGGAARFACSGRDCGESAIFAHEVFGVADLYGRDGEQHYALLTTEEGIGALYVSQRGTREVFAQLVWVASAQASAAPLPPPAETAASLAPGGRLRLVGEADVLEGWFRAFAEVQANSGDGLVLLVHRQGGAEALAQAEALAARLRTILAPRAVRAYGLGGAILGRGGPAFEVELWKITP